MAYNRWIYNILEHHQVLNAHWGVHNGPPYPLDRSLSDGKRLLPKATGSPQTKKKYKTSEKTAYQRKKRQEKIESSPDYKEKHSTTAEIKRGYRALKKKYGEYRQQATEKYQKMIELQEQGKKSLDVAKERLRKTDIPASEKEKLEDLAYDPSGKPWYKPNSDQEVADRLNKAIDDYESKQKAARDAAKEHGTAEEVMKFRDTFSKEEWDSIASRLESEARVRKLLDKPIQSFDNGGNKQNQNNGNSSNQSKSVNAPENSKLKKIYEKGTAREVYQNRDKFTVEQLEAIEKRLTAEEKIGKLANNQVFITPDRVKKLEQVRDLLGVVNGIATNANAISKAFGGSGGDGGKNKGNNNNKGNDSGESKRTTVVVEETKKDGTVKKTTTTDSTDKGPTAWLDKRKNKSK